MGVLGCWRQMPPPNHHRCAGHQRRSLHGTTSRPTLSLAWRQVANAESAGAVAAVIYDDV